MGSLWAHTGTIGCIGLSTMGVGIHRPTHGDGHLHGDGRLLRTVWYWSSMLSLFENKHSDQPSLIQIALNQ